MEKSQKYFEEHYQQQTVKLEAFVLEKIKNKEIFDKIMNKTLQIDGSPDVNLLTLQIEICASSHDAEKAKNILEKLENTSQFIHSTITYNSIIKALGSRRDYAEEAIGFLFKFLHFL